MRREAALLHLLFECLYLASNFVNLLVPLRYQLPLAMQFTVLVVNLISNFGKNLRIKFIRLPLTDITEELTVLSHCVVSAVCSFKTSKDLSF